MSEVKDPKIKLFGKTIELPETVEVAELCEPAVQSCDAAKEDISNQKPTCSSNYYVLEDSNFNGNAEDQESHQSQSCPKQDKANDENQPHPFSSNELKDSNAPPPLGNNSKEDPTESSNSQEKTLNKPDKILPCPRCNSTDTKFCYFNNYSVNQPRHFCKKCQRYWTAGGTMRNVPIGAGRRKNKNVVSSQFHPLTVPEAARVNPNGTLLAFNSDTHTPLCESMVSVLNIADKTIGSKEINGDDCSSGSSVSISKDEVPVFRGAPWPYPWQNSVHWSPPISPPTFAPTSFLVPFYSSTPPYWAGPNIWNVPFVIPPAPPTPSSGPNFPTLGKHSRDENILNPANSEDEEMQKESNNLEKCLWVPKTSRIDDPGEAAKSSIWANLGIKNDIRDDDCVGVGSGLFKAFQIQSKDDEKIHQVQEISTVLQANSAASSSSKHRFSVDGPTRLETGPSFL